jgi:hypothetical protein
MRLALALLHGLAVDVHRCSDKRLETFALAPKEEDDTAEVSSRGKKLQVTFNGWRLGLGVDEWKKIREAVCLHRLRNGRRARRHGFDLASLCVRVRAVRGPRRRDGSAISAKLHGTNLVHPVPVPVLLGCGSGERWRSFFFAAPFSLGLIPMGLDANSALLPRGHSQDAPAEAGRWEK